MARGAFAVIQEAPSAKLDWPVTPQRPRPAAPPAPPLNSRGIRGNQKQARLREAIVRQPTTGLFKALCVAQHRHLSGEASLDHISTLSRTHERINREFKVNLTERSFVKAASLAYEEMIRLASIQLRRKVIDAMDMWSLRAWRERIRAIDEGARGEAFTALRAAYEAEAGTKLLSDDQFLRALKMAAGMRRKRSLEEEAADEVEDVGEENE